MFDQILQQVNGIAGLTIGGVSLATLVVSIIAMIKSLVSLKRENRLSKQAIEQAFERAVLPNTIRLDLSKKIEEPLKLGFAEMRILLESTLERIERGEQLILTILNEFSHVNKLPENLQTEIKEYVEETKSVTVEV